MTVVYLEEVSNAELVLVCQRHQVDLHLHVAGVQEGRLLVVHLVAVESSLVSAREGLLLEVLGVLFGHEVEQLLVRNPSSDETLLDSLRHRKENSVPVLVVSLLELRNTHPTRSPDVEAARGRQPLDRGSELLGATEQFCSVGLDTEVHLDVVVPDGAVDDPIWRLNVQKRTVSPTVLVP